jgi:uncharacterized membrane protein (DUF4010 family)
MNAIVWTYPLRLAVALTLGFLIGLERESTEISRKQRVYAGIRTYSIISLFGFACAWLSYNQVVYAIPVGILSVTALVVSEYFSKIKTGRFGWTSEISAVLTFVIGALAFESDIWLPMALGIITIILLSQKTDLENFVEQLDKGEFLGVLKFLLVTLIILPVLPNQEYTQFKLNPARIWEIVILVSSIGFVGYYLSKKLGNRAGLWLSGLLGGIVSSTAVCVAVGRTAQRAPEQSWDALQASILASSVMYPRILVLVAILNPAFLRPMAWKLLLLAAIGVVISVGFSKHTPPSQEVNLASPQNPFEIKPALLFGALYTILTIITIFVTKTFGNAGLLLLSGIVGVTDIDPYVLSLIHDTAQVETILVSAIIIAMMSNTITKGIYFGVLAKQIRKETFLRFGIWALLHIPLIFFG